MAAQTKPLPEVEHVSVSIRVKGSKPNVWYNVTLAERDNAWVCTCPAWRNQPGVPGDQRSCKHTRAAGVKLGELVISGLGG